MNFDWRERLLIGEAIVGLKLACLNHHEYRHYWQGQLQVWHMLNGHCKTRLRTPKTVCRVVLYLDQKAPE